MLEICAYNVNKLGKEYFYYMYDTIVFTLFINGKNCMQNHRDIIDMCKKGFKITKCFECYYFLAKLIYGICWCCCRPTNANLIGYKYYKIFLESGSNDNLYNYNKDHYFNGYRDNMHYMANLDLIEICNDFIIDEEEKNNIKKEKYFDEIVTYCKNIKTIEDTTGFVGDKRHFEYLTESAIFLKNKTFLTELLNNSMNFNVSILDCCDLIDLLKLFYDSETFDVIKNKMNADEFNEKMIFVNFNLEKYDKMIECIDYMIETYKDSQVAYKLIDYKIMHYMLENLNVCNSIHVKLINYYFNRQGFHQISWKILFVLCFSKISNYCDILVITSYIIQLSNDKNYCDFQMMTNFNKKTYTFTKLFVDQIKLIASYISNCKFAKFYNDIKSSFSFFIGNLDVFLECEMDKDNIIKYTNPFNEANENPICCVSVTNNQSSDNKKCEIVIGNDIDYDTVYSSYSDYYDALYRINKEEYKEQNKRKIELNNYIQECLNNVYFMLDCN